jgi:hypothetical protein
MDQRTPTTLIAQGRNRLPQRRTGLLMVAIGALLMACIVSVLAYRPHNPPQDALNDGMATSAFSSTERRSLISWFSSQWPASESPTRATGNTGASN